MRSRITENGEEGSDARDVTEGVPARVWAEEGLWHDMYWAQKTGLGLSRRGRAGSSLDNSCEAKEKKEFQHQVCYPSEPEGLLAKGKPPSSFPSSITQIRLQGKEPTASVCVPCLDSPQRPAR